MLESDVSRSENKTDTRSLSSPGQGVKTADDDVVDSVEWFMLQFVLESENWQSKLVVPVLEWLSALHLVGMLLNGAVRLP